MPSSLTSADVPKAVTSGVSFLLTVNYQSTTGGTLSLEVDDGFSIVPDTYDLTTAAPGSATFPVTITRETAKSVGSELDLTFGNVNSQRIDKVQ